MHKVKFITLVEDDKDLMITFAIEDSDLGVRSLILLRTLFCEELLDEDERGVHVSIEGVTKDEQYPNLLKRIKLEPKKIEITSAFNKFEIDISQIESAEIDEMKLLLQKQNYDNKFITQVL